MLKGILEEITNVHIYCSTEFQTCPLVSLTGNLFQLKTTMSYLITVKLFND